MDQVSAVLMEECFMKAVVTDGVLGAAQSIPLLKLLLTKRASRAVLANSSNSASLLFPGAGRGAVCPEQGCAHRCQMGNQWDAFLPTARPRALHSGLTGKTSQLAASSPE